MRPRTLRTHFTCNATAFKRAHVRNDNNNILRAAELNLAFFLTSTHAGANERAKKQETKIPIHIIRCNKFDLVSVMSAPFAGKSARFCISLWVFFSVGLGVRRINLFAVFYSILIYIFIFVPFSLFSITFYIFIWNAFDFMLSATAAFESRI